MTNNIPRRVAIVLLLLAVGCIPHLRAQIVLRPAFDTLTFNAPVDLQHAGADTTRMFVVEQGGVIHAVHRVDSVWTKYVFLDLSSKVLARFQSELGLLGLAFDPGYDTNGFFYVNYTADAPLRTVVERYSVRDDSVVADTGTALEILSFPQPYENHNGGQLAFGPDGLLYIATGDGGSDGYYGPDPENRAQRVNTVYGKILRIDVRGANEEVPYTIPADNPFVGVDSARGEVFAYGLRNPWRFSFDAVTGTIWAGDVGQSEFEEVDIIEKGRNYGWKVMEGMHCNPDPCDTAGLTMPVWEYDHTVGWSITGGHVYRGTNLPELYGEYVYADFGKGTIWGLRIDSSGTAVNRVILESYGTITSFGVDAQNELYVCIYDGIIRKIDHVQIASVDAGSTPSVARVSCEPNPTSAVAIIRYTLARSAGVRLDVRDARGRAVATLVDGVQNAGDHAAVFDGRDLAAGTYYYTIDAGRGASRSGSIVLVK